MVKYSIIEVIFQKIDSNNQVRSSITGRKISEKLRNITISPILICLLKNKSIFLLISRRCFYMWNIFLLIFWIIKHFHFSINFSYKIKNYRNDDNKTSSIYYKGNSLCKKHSHNEWEYCNKSKKSTTKKI